MADTDFPDLTGKTVLQVAPELSAGGVERTVLEMTEAIVAAGGRALLASRGGRMEGEFEALGGVLFRMNAKSKNPAILALNTTKLKSLIDREQVDLVHARSRAPAWSAYRAATSANVPFVTTYHGAYSGTSSAKIKYNSVMAKGAIVIANSEWIAAHVKSVHGVPDDRLVTIPRGVDLAAFDPANVDQLRVEKIRKAWGLTGDTRLTLFLPGRLTDWKGQLTAIEAISKLAPDEAEKLVLVLAGDAQGRGSYVNKLEDAIIAGEMGGTILICDHVTDMPAAYKASDIVLAPSTRPEAFGRVAAEASAMQRPIIVSDHGGGRETVVEAQTGTRFEPGNAIALSGAIRAMIDIGPDARAGMGKAGRAYISERFSKRGLQAATLGVYKRLLKD
jgi:glycosyltransferase involved in cell wall biosynthesis